MFDSNLEHPEISRALATGYPSWKQPKVYCCSRCGYEIDGEIYEDFDHDYLCECCLLELHRKEW